MPVRHEDKTILRYGMSGFSIALMVIEVSQQS